MPDRNGYIGRAPSDSSVQVARQSFTASGITTDFTFSSGYTPGYFDIYINGVKMIEGSDYTSSDGSTFSILNGGASDGDVLEAVAYKAFNAAATVADVTGNFSVGNNLTVGRDATVSGVGLTTALTFDGTAENDSSIALTGGTAGDTLTGTDTTTKGDTIKGNGGADTIDGSKGGDTLTGGAGADIFTYNAIADSNTGAKDSITDFLSGTDGLAVTLDYSSSTQDLTITGDVTTVSYTHLTLPTTPYV